MQPLYKVVFIMVMVLMKAYFLVGFVYLQEVIWRKVTRMRLLIEFCHFWIIDRLQNQQISSWGTVLYQLYYMLLFKRNWSFQYLD